MVQSSFFQTSCFKIIHNAIKDIDKDTLVIFDIDDVLITAKDHVLRNPHKEKWLNTYFYERFSPQEILYLSGFAWTSYKAEITDPYLITLYQSLKDRGIRTIALTAGWNGALGTSMSHCNDRVISLQNLGLDFSESFPYLPEISFQGFENCGRIPSFKNGIIFSCMLPKSQILNAFLKITAYQPKKIIFVDDMLNNIENIKEYCENQGISFQGFHYIGVESRNNKALDKAVAHLQFKTVIKNKIWLGDEEAKEMLRKMKIKSA